MLSYPTRESAGAREGTIKGSSERAVLTGFSEQPNFPVILVFVVGSCNITLLGVIYRLQLQELQYLINISIPAPLEALRIATETLNINPNPF